jgi:hypothetical protein
VHHIGAASNGGRFHIESDAQPSSIDTNPHLQGTAGPGERCVFPRASSATHPAITVLKSKSVLTVERQHALLVVDYQRRNQTTSLRRRRAKTRRPAHAATRPGSPAPRRQRDKLLKVTNVRNGILPKSDAERLPKQAIAGNRSRNHQAAAELLGIVLQSLSEFSRPLTTRATNARHGLRRHPPTPTGTQFWIWGPHLKRKRLRRALRPEPGPGDSPLAARPGVALRVLRRLVRCYRPQRFLRLRELIVQFAVAHRSDQDVDDHWDLVERRNGNGVLALVKLNRFRS